MTRKSYTTDFKREAASLVLDQGYSVRTACEGSSTFRVEFAR